uniref:Transposase Tc1-like domain-containing protein n=1 Tax=Amphimedon queenslandica TaxID=400682 RepID=A0A1X7U032_AMPQE
MQLDNETTAIQFQRILADNGHPLNLMTTLRSREKVGWTFHGSAYCQLIREVNKGNRLRWAQEHVQEACSDGGFLNVLWTDEYSVMLECRRFCCRKEGTPARA